MEKQQEAQSVSINVSSRNLLIMNSLLQDISSMW